MKSVLNIFISFFLLQGSLLKASELDRGEFDLSKIFAAQKTFTANSHSQTQKNYLLLSKIPIPSLFNVSLVLNAFENVQVEEQKALAEAYVHAFQDWISQTGQGYNAETISEKTLFLINEWESKRKAEQGQLSDQEQTIFSMLREASSEKVVEPAPKLTEKDIQLLCRLGPLYASAIFLFVHDFYPQYQDLIEAFIPIQGLIRRLNLEEGRQLLKDQMRLVYQKTQEFRDELRAIEGSPKERQDEEAKARAPKIISSVKEIEKAIETIESLSFRLGFVEPEIREKMESLTKAVADRLHIDQVSIDLSEGYHYRFKYSAGLTENQLLELHQHQNDIYFYHSRDSRKEAVRGKETLDKIGIVSSITQTPSHEFWSHDSRNQVRILAGRSHPPMLKNMAL